jgi:hypothetical protein
MGDLPLRGLQVPGRAQPPTGSTAVDAGLRRAGQPQRVADPLSWRQPAAAPGPALVIATAPEHSLT